VPEITSVTLSKYRMEKAADMLSSAKRDMEAKDYASANNRAYYCIFHAMRAVLGRINRPSNGVCWTRRKRTTRRRRGCSCCRSIC